MAGEDFHERGFARAVLTDNGLNFAGAEIEADVLQHFHRAEGFRQAFDRNGWGGRTDRDAASALNRTALRQAAHACFLRPRTAPPLPSRSLDIHRSSPARAATPITTRQAAMQP